MKEDLSLATPLDSPLTGNARPEKAMWYQEVLALDPNSRIFLPYARLLAELGRKGEAIDALKAGLGRHPEFLEARLFLIELLHDSGQDAAAGFEAESIIEQLSQTSALWRIWSRKPGLRADQSAMLLFFASSMGKGGLSLAEVFEAGIKALAHPSSPNNDEARAKSPAPAAPRDFSEEKIVPAPAPVSDVTPAAKKPEPDNAPAQAFSMPEDAAWYALDSVPEDDDIYDETDEPAAAVPFPLPLVAPTVLPAPSLPAQTEVEHIPAMTPVPRSQQEGKSSLCTRSMARVLEEQGATEEAADIYRELLEACSSPEEQAELSEKLTSLLQNGESSPAQPSNSSILDMLEELADRLENRTRA
ncbi:MAG: hypothetical protein IJZ18_03500 [Mailhella sp.]|nr:hypothetical protein [Mailhella sp.]